jgi:hypothetical protein
LQTLTNVADNRLGGELLNALTFHAEAGVIYAVAMDTPPEETGAFQLALMPTNAPANDDFARRVVLTGLHAHTEALNEGATLEQAEPNSLGSPVDATLWWTWTAPASGPTTIDTTGSSFDTFLSVYQGSTLPSLVLLAANDDAGIVPQTPLNLASRLTFNAQAGGTYQIRVASSTGGHGLVSLTLLGPNAPPAQLLSAEILDAIGACQLRLRGSPGQTVWIQSSSDLLNWQWVYSVRFVSADAVWSEPIVPGGLRFFRLVSLQ